MRLLSKNASGLHLGTVKLNVNASLKTTSNVNKRLSSLRRALRNATGSRYQEVKNAIRKMTNYRNQLERSKKYYSENIYKNNVPRSLRSRRRIFPKHSTYLTFLNNTGKRIYLNRGNIEYFIHGTKVPFRHLV
jgi:DNA-binding protein H-NS